MSTAPIRPTPTEVAETFQRVGGIATEHGLDLSWDGDYIVCTCIDRAHTPAVGRAFSTKGDAVSEAAYTSGPRHIVRRERMTLTALTEVNPW